jgi:hypothetical protein
VELDADQRARLDSLRRVLVNGDQAVATGARAAIGRTEAIEPTAPRAARGGLTVRLAFEDDVDLDLFVTDPAQESVYFANSPSRSGGILLADRRCGDPAPRVETIRYSSPMAGRYRVGVDFPRRCEPGLASGVSGSGSSSGSEAEALYLVHVEEGERVLERGGLLQAGVFEVIVLEFDVASRPAEPRPSASRPAPLTSRAMPASTMKRSAASSCSSM